jgi:hypothetical protein
VISVNLSWTMPHGAEGQDDAADNPLARALERLFSSGRSFKRLTLCFCADRRKTEKDPILRWLGVFILSEAGRIIFFPGFRQTKQYVRGFRGKPRMWHEKFDFDHVSLEKDWRRWHITTRGSKRQRGGPLTTPLGQDRYFWFGLSLSNLDELRVVKQSTNVIGDMPPSDARRRVDVLKQARENAEFPILDWHEQVWVRPLERLWHIGIIVKQPESSLYTGSMLGLPEGSPFLRSPLPLGEVQLPLRRHQVKLAESVGLQITTTVIQGAMTVPVALTGPSELR